MPTPVITPYGLEPAFDLAAYYPLLMFAAIVIAMATGIVAASHFLFVKPYNPTRVKAMPYESGMDPIGSARMQFDVKFYLIAILFLVFDVELLLLYPWAVVAYSSGGDQLWRQTYSWLIFGIVVSFLVKLAIALFYDWRKGVLTWR